ncbi:Hypothetical protein NTJ_14103 [Nesidiocoris tenuis]|uniref:Uncharacterized protein n=1 Tax=Nesidiocoris tenuis TaxID=355587 RepID=A0ABN7BA86_9HEMI|nr:Hypothetical protein NTJ_14103 [Nesidiocoris tenuis]
MFITPAITDAAFSPRGLTKCAARAPADSGWRNSRVLVDGVCQVRFATSPRGGWATEPNTTEGPHAKTPMQLEKAFRKNYQPLPNVCRVLSDLKMSDNFAREPVNVGGRGFKTVIFGRQNSRYARVVHC